MSRRIMWAVLAVVPLATAAAWTDPRSSALAEPPLAAMQLVSPDDYREAFGELPSQTLRRARLR